MIGPYEEIARLDAMTGGSLIKVAAAEFERLSAALLEACQYGSDADVIAARHALSGICRIMGADSLEAAAQAALRDADEKAAFQASLALTLKQIEQLALQIERRCLHGP